MTIRTLDLIKSKNYLLLFLFVELFFVFAISLRNLNDEYLWYDESGQFWIAKGLNHDSDPYSPEGTIADVIDNNQFYNMDPGGFGIIAHYWTMINNHVIWLRMLPFLFFIGIVYLFFKMSKDYLEDTSVAVLAIFIPFFFPTMLNMAFEFRAYSMEVLGTFLLVFGLDKLKNDFSTKNVLIYGIICAIFMTSRYAVVIMTVASSFYVLYLILRIPDNFKHKLKLAFAYALPISIGIAYIYLFALRYQNSGLEQLKYLQYLSNDPTVLFRPINAAYLILVFGLIPFVVVPKLRQLTVKYRTLIMICLILHALYLTLSLIGIYPWRVGSKSNLSINLLLLFTIYILAADFIKRKEWVPVMMSFSLIVFGAATVTGFNRYLYPKHDNSIYPLQDMHANTHYDFDQIETEKHHKIFVESWENPFIRYEYEYGRHKANTHQFYPNRFYLQKGVPHPHFTKPESLESFQKKLPKMNQLKGFDLIISSDLYDWSKSNNNHWHKVSGSDNMWEHD